MTAQQSSANEEENVPSEPMQNSPENISDTEKDVLQMSPDSANPSADTESLVSSVTYSEDKSDAESSIREEEQNENIPPDKEEMAPVTKRSSRQSHRRSASRISSSRNVLRSW